MIKNNAKLDSDNPSVVGLALPADLLITAPLTPEMYRFDTEAVYHAKKRGLRQKMLRPVLMSGQWAKDAGVLRQVWKQRRLPQPSGKKRGCRRP